VRIFHGSGRHCVTAASSLFLSSLFTAIGPQLLIRQGGSMLILQLTSVSRDHSTVDACGSNYAKPPRPLGDVYPHLIHQSLGQLHSPPKTTAQLLHTLLRTNATNYPLVTMVRPISTLSIAPCCGVISTPISFPYSLTQLTH